MPDDTLAAARARLRAAYVDLKEKIHAHRVAQEAEDAARMAANTAGEEVRVARAALVEDASGDEQTAAEQEDKWRTRRVPVGKEDAPA